MSTFIPRKKRVSCLRYQQSHACSRFPRSLRKRSVDRIKRHARKGLSFCLLQKGLFTILCKDSHGVGKNAHFHCPTCESTFTRKEYIKRHLDTCTKVSPPRNNSTSTSVATPSPPVSAPAPQVSAPAPPMAAPATQMAAPAPPMAAPATQVAAPAPPMAAPATQVAAPAPQVSAPAPPVTDSTPVTQPQPIPMKDNKEKTGETAKRQCPICMKSVNKKWLKYHMKIHEKKTLTNTRHYHTVLIQAERGLYCASKSLKGRVIPIHLVKKTSGSEHQVFCEHLQCIYEKQTAERGGNVSYECDHIKSIAYAVPGNVVNLENSVLDELSENGFISSSRKVLVQQLQAKCIESNTPLAVVIPNQQDASSSYLNLSIFSGVQRYWSKIDRTIVTVDLKSNVVSCRCSTDKRYCTHKAVAKWYLKQEMPSHFSSSSEEVEGGENEENVDGHPDVDSINADTLEYIMSKSFPPGLPGCLDIQKNLQKLKVSKEVIPTESECHICHGPLAQEISTRSGKLIMLNEVVTDIKVFVKKCTLCHVEYTYQDWVDGFHNYSNKLLLGHDVFLFLRNGIENHIAIGRSLAALSGLLNAALNIQEITEAYLHMEALTDHSYNFNCVLCGYHPAIIIWDTFRKAGFRYSVTDLPPNHVGNDQVNIDNFWTEIRKSVIAKGTSADSSHVEPDYKFWGPWIGDKTRMSNDVYNTEYKKCAPDSDLEINEPVPEEIIFHLLSDEKVANLRKLCTELGINSKGSSTDIINRIREKSVSRTGFDKAYEKVFGRTVFLISLEGEEEERDRVIAKGLGPTDQ